MIWETEEDIEDRKKLQFISRTKEEIPVILLKSMDLGLATKQNT